MKKHILLVSSREVLNDILKQWSRPEAYKISLAHTDELAIEMCHRDHFDMVVMEREDAEVNHNKLNRILPILQDNVPLVSYGGEPLQDLQNRIINIFEKRKLERIKRLLVLDATPGKAGQKLPPFSVN